LRGAFNSNTFGGEKWGKTLEMSQGSGLNEMSSNQFIGGIAAPGQSKKWGQEKRKRLGEERRPGAPS